MERGKLYGNFVGRQFVAKYGAENVELEREINWGNGWIGHADIYVKPEKLIVEVVSTTNPSGQILEDKMTQLKGYVHFDPEAEIGALYIINPSSLEREDVWTVSSTDEDREELENRAAEIVKAFGTQGRLLPDRICAKPSEGRSHLCPFVETCFAGWEPPPAIPLDGVVEGLAPALYHADQGVRAARDMLSVAEDHRDEIRNQILEAGLEPGEYEGAGVSIRLTEVKGRETFQFAAAKKARQWTSMDDERLGLFVKIGQPSYRWKVEAVGEVPAPEHVYGDDIPF